jgi:hypothetical protein
MFSVGSVPRSYKRRAQSEDRTEYRTVADENWVEFWRWQTNVIEKKLQERI